MDGYFFLNILRFILTISTVHFLRLLSFAWYNVGIKCNVSSGSEFRIECAENMHINNAFRAMIGYNVAPKQLSMQLHQMHLFYGFIFGSALNCRWFIYMQFIEYISLSACLTVLFQLSKGFMRFTRIFNANVGDDWNNVRASLYAVLLSVTM